MSKMGPLFLFGKKGKTNLMKWEREARQRFEAVLGWGLFGDFVGIVWGVFKVRLGIAWGLCGGLCGVCLVSVRKIYEKRSLKISKSTGRGTKSTLKVVFRRPEERLFPEIMTWRLKNRIGEKIWESIFEFLGLGARKNSPKILHLLHCPDHTQEKKQHKLSDFLKSQSCPLWWKNL